MDHDGETTISPSSSLKLPAPLTTLLSKILLKIDFGLRGRAVEAKWRHYKHTTSVGSVEIVKQKWYQDKWLSDETFSSHQGPASVPGGPWLQWGYDEQGHFVMQRCCNAWRFQRIKSTWSIPTKRRRRWHLWQSKKGDLGILHHNTRRTSGTPAWWKEEFSVITSRWERCQWLI